MAFLSCFTVLDISMLVLVRYLERLHYFPYLNGECIFKQKWWESLFIRTTCF